MNNKNLLHEIETLIEAERRRQIHEKGFTLSKDDEYIEAELYFAAMAYKETKSGSKKYWWPWPNMLFKPTPKHRATELIKAGALIKAEKDRLNRIYEKIVLELVKIKI